MKIIIFVMLLTALPFSMNWGQVYHLTEAEIDSILRYIDTSQDILIDTTENWEREYLKQKHRADSLASINDTLKEKLWHYIGETALYRGSVKALNRQLDECMAERDNQWQGEWRIDTTWGKAGEWGFYEDEYWGTCKGIYMKPYIKSIDTTWRPIVPCEGE